MGLFKTKELHRFVENCHYRNISFNSKEKQKKWFEI